MAAQAGLCLAWSETPKDKFSRVVAHISTRAMTKITKRYPDDDLLIWQKCHNTKRRVHKILTFGCTKLLSGIMFSTKDVMQIRLAFFIIGITHDFLCINICWAPREVFEQLPSGPADVNVSKKHV